VNLDGFPDFAAGAPDWDTTQASLTDNGQLRFYTGGSTPVYVNYVGGLANNSHMGTSGGIGLVLYRPNPGVAASATSGPDPSTAGGAVLILGWAP
jgi:hypothetical protein